MTDDDANSAHQSSAQTDAIRLDLSRFRHFGDEWQQICQTLLSCERLLAVMSDERHDISDDKHDAVDRQQLRQIIKSIEPKKYSKSCAQRRQTRRSSYHRLKALTQLLMTSNLKRSTSLQSVPVVTTTEALDDSTATLPRLRRRPKINRFYHSLDVSDDNNECDDSQHKGDRSGLSLVLTSSPSAQLLPTTTEQTQKQLNRHSCDVTSLLSPSSQTSSQSREQSANRQILKYSKKRLRGPYGEMLESMMSTRNNCDDSDRQSLTFIQELLRETEKQRKALDGSARETTGTKDDTPDEKPDDKTTVDHQKTSITATIGRHLDARTHIVGELYDTEKSFCEQMKDLWEKYARPLSLVIDSTHVNLIFGRIPDILSVHSRFLEALRRKIANWSEETTVGDLFALFEAESARDAYSAFVDNWLDAKSLVKSLSREKPAFQRLLAEQSREHRSKLSLDEMMISIIQRIPRFELLLKQLLKNTRQQHPDFDLLNNALTKIHSLVLYINRVKNDSLDSSSLSSSSTVGQQVDVNQSSLLSASQLLEICDGLPAQSVVGATLHLIATVLIRKRERVLLLLSNILVIVSIKGRKKSEKFEENKYKVLNFFSLDSLETNFENNSELNSENSLEVLEKDLQIIQTIQTSFSARLSSDSRNFLDSVLGELNQNISKRMNELKNSEKNLELVVVTTPERQQTTHDSSVPQNTILLTFLSQEKRQKFDRIFKELKSEKSKPNSRLIPEFLCFLPIRKTRAGLQFTCASPTIGTNDVWICNSDGYVGQISVLSLNWTTTTTTSSNQTIEPTIVSSNGVCNSRIICMTCVPKSPQTPSPTQTSEESDVSDSESDTNATNSRRQQSSSRSSLSSATMWFGTDDYSVHIYSCFDAIRIKKNKVKVTLSAKVEAITYFAEKVFVSLANQSVAVFQREVGSGSWNTVPVIKENANCFRFCCVRSGEQLWTCGHSSMSITIRDSDLKPLFEEMQVSDDSDDYITHMASVDDSCRVFVATHNSLSIHCFSSEQPFIHLSNISIQTTLNRALIACEDIIRQHKSACLKISCLLAVRQQLWIGTSAGVICVLDANHFALEIGAPSRSSTEPMTFCSQKPKYSRIRFSLVPNGHTGHVRFLTTAGPSLVISGGDGIELYRRCAASGQLTAESGRDDSTNHVILFCCK